ncbi:hypothetical protein [Magnetospirillum fulvum]|uniref:Uncharacterized protein n=1 Tax=Magnetospirillum fulvum TaxID=1082 RepID=A0A1H6H2T5_MAGFU|nr:hypothetical protein [Magnetospirillum fulvum]SEH28508.1 hypothetical protein SAMN04244559_00715 [Magnetospirillum fulvum]
MPTLLLHLQFLQTFVVVAGANGQSYATIRWLLAYRDALLPTSVAFISNVTGALALINTGFAKNYNPNFLALLGRLPGTTPVLLADIFEKLKIDRTDTWTAAGSELQALMSDLSTAYNGCAQTGAWGRGLPDAPFDATAIVGTLGNVMGLSGTGVQLPYLASEADVAPPAPI